MQRKSNRNDHLANHPFRLRGVIYICLNSLRSYRAFKTPSSIGSERVVYITLFEVFRGFAERGKTPAVN